MSAPLIPNGGLAVMRNVAAGQSPWQGWEAGHAARTPEGQDAYEQRARAITGLRERGYLTVENRLTNEGRFVLAQLEAPAPVRAARG